MAIIAILISLLTSAVVRALIKVEEVRTRNEISQLSSAIQNFQTKYGVDYIPSVFMIREDGMYNMANPVEADSYNYIIRLWPRIVPTGAAPGQIYPIDWNNNNQIDPPVLLSGDQCLVFFLGGVQIVSPGPPVTPGCMGFSSDNTNPAKLTGDRVAPFYEFKSDRLVVLPANALNGNNYFSCLDPYGNVYAYFSTYKSRNGYNRYGTSDCPNLGVSPYIQSIQTPPTPPLVMYWNPDSYQIISAGRNKMFGPGGLWSPGNTNANGSDDLANFFDGLLGN
jgi:hypothetical protein